MKKTPATTTKRKPLRPRKGPKQPHLPAEATPRFTLSTVWKQQLFAIAKFIGAASRTVLRVGLYKGPG